MTYADTDFFLALMKQEDWLKAKARKRLKEFKGRLWTSAAAVIEIMLLAEAYQLEADRIVLDVTEIAEVRGVEVRLLQSAACYMVEDGLRTFDALHAAFCQGDEILSSDKVFERVGLKRIPLEGDS